LHLAAKQPADLTKGWVPYYVFHIMCAKTGRRAGEIHLRAGNTGHLRLYGGHVAYGIHPEFRGNHFAARALRRLMPLARRHGLPELWITCNPENVASRRTCVLAGAELIEIVDLAAACGHVSRRRAAKVQVPAGSAASGIEHGPHRYARYMHVRKLMIPVPEACS
jgi:predicted acetyltransferase